MSTMPYYITARRAAESMNISSLPALIVKLRYSFLLVEFADRACGCESSQCKFLKTEDARHNIGLAVNKFLYEAELQDEYIADIAHKMNGASWFVTLRYVEDNP